MTTTALDRFKMLLANALERVCLLETELEQAQQRIEELVTAAAVTNGDRAEVG